MYQRNKDSLNVNIVLKRRQGMLIIVPFCRTIVVFVRTLFDV